MFPQSPWTTLEVLVGKVLGAEKKKRGREKYTLLLVTYKEF